MRQTVSGSIDRKKQNSKENKTIPYLVLAIFSMLLLLFSPAVCAADNNGGSELGKLISEIYLAYGGKDNLTKLDTCYTLLGSQIQTPVTAASPADEAATAALSNLHYRQMRKGSNLRIDIEPAGQSPPVTTVFDGVSAWKSTGKIVEELSDSETLILKNARDHEPSVVVHFGEPPYEFKLLGRTTYRATPAYAIEVRHNASTSTLFVDEKNYLVLGLTYCLGKQAESSTVSVDFSQYRPSNGTLYPFKQIQYVGAQPVNTIQVTSLDMSTDVDAAQFRRPGNDDIRLAKSMTIPFEFTHKEIIVKVRINDSEPLDFLFDTAASQTVIDRRVAAENYLDKQGSVPVNAAGGVVPTQLTAIKKFCCNDIEINDIQALMLDLTPQSKQLGKRVAGIIGANIIKKFAITVDFAKSQLVFNDATTYKPPAGAMLVPFNSKQGPTVKAWLNGTTETTFLIDTGAAFNNLPSHIAKNFVAGQTPHLTEGTGLDGRPVKLATMIMPSVRIGSQTIKNVSFTYSVEQDAQAQTKGFVQSAGLGVLGNPFWQNFLATFDYKFQRLVLQPNAVQTARQEIDQLITDGDSKLIVYRDLRAAQGAYEKALLKVQALNDPRLQARVWGRIGNLRRVMAKDLNRPEQARIAYEYFSKAQELAHKLEDRETEGRVLADWSLLYLDNGQIQAAHQALQGATFFAPQDAQVNVDFAVYLYKMQLYADMQKYIEKALFLDPANWQALWYKVKLADMHADQLQQIATLKEIIKVYPWSKVAKDKLLTLTASAPGSNNQPQQQSTGMTPVPNVPMIVPTLSR